MFKFMAIENLKLELPYSQYLRGRGWTPGKLQGWKTVLVPPSIDAIASQTQYFYFLVRRVEALIEQEIENERQTAQVQVERQAEFAVAKGISDFLPAKVNPITRWDAPRQTAECLVEGCEGLQSACFPPAWQTTFPIALPSQMADDADYCQAVLESMTLWEWLSAVTLELDV